MPTFWLTLINGEASSLARDPKLETPIMTYHGKLSIGSRSLYFIKGNQLINTIQRSLSPRETTRVRAYTPVFDRRRLLIRRGRATVSVRT